MALTTTQRRFCQTHLGLSEAGGAATADLGPILAALEFVVFDARRSGVAGMDLEATMATGEARKRAPPLDTLAPDERARLEAAYVRALRTVASAEREIAARVESAALTADDIRVATEFWRSQPQMPAAALLASPVLAHYPPDEDATPILGRARQGPWQDTPTQPAGPAPNAGASTSIAAPASILDAGSRRALSGSDAPALSEDIAGTGGIRKITAVRRDDGSLAVTITGEILPGRLQRDRSKPLEPGQSHAPDFNGAGRNFLAPLTSLGLAQPGNWERCHLWGPGFGDEAAAGMLLGPREVNQVFQNRGVEAAIRTLGRLTAPLRGQGFALELAASTESWPTPTPGGFATANQERLFRSAEYQLTLRSPAPGGGTVEDTARISIELDTDPGAVNAGAEPVILVGIEHRQFNTMMSRLPD